MREEREQFQQFIGRLSEADLHAVEPLFYRRVLSSTERATIWTRLQALWSITESYWYPLTERSRNDVVAWQDRYFNQSVSTTMVQNLLRERGIIRLWELREHGPEYELDVSAFEPYYNGAEGYWCAEPMDWVIYASYESSITVGGAWLIQAIQQRWPAWQAYLWTTPFFE